MSANEEGRWDGNESLRPLLVPLDDLHPHPRNPRRGAVPEVAKSLDRFGQQRPVLALPDGTLVAGHHVWRAARELGWNRIAVVRSDLPSHDVEGYLLADNRTSDLGSYDDALLGDLLRDLAEDGTLDGTGWSPEDVGEILASEPPPPEPEPQPREPEESAEVREVTLTLAADEHRLFMQRVRGLSREYGTGGPTDTVVEAVAREFRRSREEEAA